MQKKNDTTGSLNNADARTHTQPLGACVSDVGNLKEQNDEASAGADVQPRGLGAPPSNTAPANYIPDNPVVDVLMTRVDSLYLSFKGQLHEEWFDHFTQFKMLARSPDDRLKALAQVRIGEHNFEVKPKGRGKYLFVIADGCFNIALSGKDASSLPFCYVQISSAFLEDVDVATAVDTLLSVINTFGTYDELSISRVDLCTDFTTNCPLDIIQCRDWVTRAHCYSSYYYCQHFSGFSIGLGGDLSARLYDKTLELSRFKKKNFHKQWSELGWDGEKTVWRMEFQLKKQVLKELQVNTITELLDNLAGIWHYTTSSWLRLTIPDHNENQSRWPLHPIWVALSQVSWNNARLVVMKRIRTARIPSDQSLYINGLGAITSFMACEGITDTKTGFNQFLTRASQFHSQPGEPIGKPFDEYIKRKVALKNKRFNTILNHHFSLPQMTKAPEEDHQKGE